MNRLLYFYPILFSAISYYCTRGTDGQLFIFIWAYGGLFLMYSMGIFFLKLRSFTAPLIHFAIALFASIAVMALPSNLEGMGGMLYFIVPGALFIGLGISLAQIAVQKAYSTPVSG